MGYPMLNFSIRPDAVMAMVDRIAELDDASDEFIAGVLETESWEEFIARAAAAAFCEAEGLRVDDDNGHNACYRLISDWKEKP